MRLNPLTGQMERDEFDVGLEPQQPESPYPLTRAVQKLAPTLYGYGLGVKESITSPLHGEKTTPSLQDYARDVVGSKIESLTGVNPYARNMVAGTNTPPQTTSLPEVKTTTAPPPSTQGTQKLPDVRMKKKTTVTPPQATITPTETAESQLPKAPDLRTLLSERKEAIHKAYEQVPVETTLPEVQQLQPVTSRYNPMDYAPSGMAGQFESMAGGLKAINNPFAQAMAGFGQGLTAQRLGLAGLAEKQGEAELNRQKLANENIEQENKFNVEQYARKVAINDAKRKALLGQQLTDDEIKMLMEEPKVRSEIAKNKAMEKSYERTIRGQAYIDPETGQVVPVPRVFAPQRASTPKDYRFQAAQAVLRNPMATQEDIDNANAVMQEYLKSQNTPPQQNDTEFLNNFRNALRGNK